MTTAMSPLASRRFVLLANPESRRVELFQKALQQMGCSPAIVIAYQDWLAGHGHLGDVIRAGDIVRLESPGKNFAVEKYLLILGAAMMDDPAFEKCERAADLPVDKGRILYSRQWYLGFCAMLRQLSAQLDECETHQRMNHIPDIPIMFDKSACHALLQQHGLAVPPTLGVVYSYEELLAKMRASGMTQVFIKLAHGSSASGVVAYRQQGQQQVAITTVEMVQRGDAVHLYNSRQLRTYRQVNEIALLIDTLCRQRVHVEQWLPKAQLHGQTCDLRILMIKGRVRHVIPRLSRSPITNLHLLNERGEFTDLLAVIGEQKWAAICQTCEAAMQLFPHSLHCGLDLLIDVNLKHHAILELNAFGDLLPGILWQGQDTYTAELAALCPS